MTTQRSDTGAGGGQRGSAADPAASGDPAAIRADIERTRAELGDTVEALAAKTDVKARAQDAAHAAKVRVQDSVAETAHAVADEAKQVRQVIARRPVPAAAVAGAAAAVTALLVLLGRRASRRRAARRSRAWRGRATRRR